MLDLITQSKWMLVALLYVGNAQAADLKVAVSRTPLSLPIYVAQDQGFFKSRGVDVEIVECLGGQRCMQMMAQGQADYATSSELPAVFMALERSYPFAIVATFVTNTRDLKFIVKRAAVRTDLQGFEDKTIALTSKTSGQYFSDVFLTFNGIDPKKVKQLNLPPEKLEAAILSGAADAVVTWDPFAYRILKNNPDTLTEVKRPLIYTQSFNLSAGRQTLTAKPAETIKILNALQDAIQYIRKNPKQSQNLLGKILGLDDEYLRASWSDLVFDLHLRQSLLTDMDNQAKWATEAGYAQAGGKQVNLLNYVAPEYLMKIAPNKVSFSHQ